MSGKTPIEWTRPPGFEGATWNPTLGCAKVSPGCKFCYAIRDVWRMAHNPNEKIAAANAGLVERTGAGLNWTGKVNLLPERLTIPRRKKAPTCYFVNSLSDLFHEYIPDDFIDKVFAAMALCPQHRFIVLTKRADRMRKYCVRRAVAMAENRAKECASLHSAFPDMLPNVQLGVSVENPATAHDRIPHLMATPAATRIVSFEPALEPVDFMWFGHGFDQIIVGFESGPEMKVRPGNLEIVRETIKQGAAMGIAVFVKQLGTVPVYGDGELIQLASKKGSDMSEWPADVRVRQYPGEVLHE